MQGDLLDYTNALLESGPILLIPGFDNCAPDHRAMACAKSWHCIPDFGPVGALFDRIPNYFPWFGIFSLAHGAILQFHYPETACDGARIRVIYYADRIIPGGTIEWRHGAVGLAEGECFDVMVSWANALARRRSSAGAGSTMPGKS